MGNVSKWVKFVNEVSFKGMTSNNKSVLEYIAIKSNSNGAELTYRSIADYAGVTKNSAKNNARKLEAIGLLKTKHQYGGGHKDTLPLIFKINLDWK